MRNLIKWISYRTLFQADRLSEARALIWLLLFKCGGQPEVECARHGQKVNRMPIRKDFIFFIFGFIFLSFFFFLCFGFPCGSAGIESSCNAGDLGSIPALGRSCEERKGYPIHDSGWENSMDCIIYGVSKRQTGLSGFPFHFQFTQVFFKSLIFSLSELRRLCRILNREVAKFELCSYENLNQAHCSEENVYYMRDIRKLLHDPDKRSLQSDKSISMEIIKK